MIDLTEICQPGDRVTLITRTKVVVATITSSEEAPPCAPTWPPSPSDPSDSQEGGYLTLHAQGIGACATLKVEIVRERGED